MPDEELVKNIPLTHLELDVFIPPFPMDINIYGFRKLIWTEPVERQKWYARSGVGILLHNIFAPSNPPNLINRFGEEISAHIKII